MNRQAAAQDPLVPAWPIFPIAAEPIWRQIGCQTQKSGSIEADGARQIRSVSGEPQGTRTPNPLIKSWLLRVALPACYGFGYEADPHHLHK